MKRLFFLWVLIITGCSRDYLNKTNPAVVSYGDVFLTIEDFESALAGCYSSMAKAHTTTILLGDILSDNVFVSKYSLTSPWALLDHLVISSENQIISDYWFANYQSIQICNLLLSRSEIANITDARLEVIQLEAKFIRAFSYFNLLRSFGGVPLYFENVDIDKTFEIPRASEKEISDAIISDLNEVLQIDNLRRQLGLDKTIGRVNSTAAKVLLSKLYLWTYDYKSAEILLKEIIDSNKYSLSNFHDLFSADNTSDAEIILGIFYERVNGFSSPFAATTVPYNQIGIYPNIDRYFGSGMCNIENYFMEKLSTNDLRRTLIDSAIFRSLSSTIDTNIYSLKYVDPLTTSDGFSGSNTIIYRYADILLMYADALNEDGDHDGAINYLNLVRNRSQLVDLSHGKSKEEIREIISDERQKEFILEGDRWFDLRYRGIGYFKSVINDFTSKAVLTKDLNVQDHFLLLPLPSSELLIKPILNQNVGY